VGSKIGVKFAHLFTPCKNWRKLAEMSVGIFVATARFCVPVYFLLGEDWQFGNVKEDSEVKYVASGNFVAGG